MLIRSREARVFAALAISMAVGVVILQAMGNNPPSAGAFCLSRYTRIIPVQEAVLSRAPQPPGRWNCIEIYYSRTMSGDIRQLAFLGGLANPEDINCHFIICNGIGGSDGQIQPTEKWQKQQPVNRDWLNHEPQVSISGQAIFICVIADDKNAPPTKMQIEVTEALAEELCRKFDIPPESICFPGRWR